VTGPRGMCSIALACQLVVAAGACAQGHEPTGNRWEDHQVFAVNKLEPHATWFPYGTRDAALRDEQERSPWYQSLDGSWKFHWSRKPADAPAGFEQPSFDVSGWHDIPVPANWEVEGHGHAIYLDVRWIALTDSDGPGLVAVGAELLIRDFVTWNVDARQMGVGGDTSWGRPVHPEYTIPADDHRLRYRLIPFDRRELDPGEVARSARAFRPDS